jgi:hypothetical protein
VIVLYPALLLVAVTLIAVLDREGGRGWRWFVAWCIAGAFFFFSLLTGLSIGLLLLPVAAAALVVVAVTAPHFAEASGFVAGVGAVAVAIATLNWGEPHIREALWLALGVATTIAALAAYTVGGGQPRRPIPRG